MLAITNHAVKRRPKSVAIHVLFFRPTTPKTFSVRECPLSPNVTRLTALSSNRHRQETNAIFTRLVPGRN